VGIWTRSQSLELPDETLITEAGGRASPCRWLEENKVRFDSMDVGFPFFLFLFFCVAAAEKKTKQTKHKHTNTPQS